MKIDKQNLQKYMSALAKEEVIFYRDKTSKNYLKFLLPREDDHSINRIAKEITDHQKNIVYKAEKMMEYPFLKNCRQVFMSDYFGNKHESCGSCDICHSNDENKIKILLENILKWVAKSPKTAEKISEKFCISDKMLTKTLEKGLEKGILKMDENFRFAPLQK